MSARSEMGEGGLRRSLGRVGRRIGVVAGIGGVGWGIFAALAVLLSAAWIDLVVELSSVVRVWVLGLGGAAAAGAVLWMAWVGWRRGRPGKVARRLDGAAETGGEVRTGWELLSVGEAARPVTEGLRHLAVRRAGEVAGSVAAGIVAPMRGAFRPYLFFTAGVVLVVIVALVAPRLAVTQWVRILSPWVDRPPYSPYEFMVEPGDVEVLYGEDLDILVAFAAVQPEELEMVVEAKAGGAREVLPLFPERGGGWRGVLRDLRAPVRYTVRAPRGRTRAFEVGIIYTPEIRQVIFRLTPPAYTRMPAREGPLPERGLRGLEGTKVECVARSNRPLAEGDIEVEWEGGDVERIAMAPGEEADNSVGGEFIIKKSGRLSLGIRDTDGLDGRTRVTGAIKKLEDKRPFVRIVQPVHPSFATPTVRVPVVVEADDDYGLTGLWLYRSLNDSREVPLALLEGDDEMRQATAEVELPLGLYKLEPNDVLTFYARVQDNDPNWPKGAESELVRVTIISQEDFDRLTKAKATLEELLTKYRSQQRALEALRERLEEDIKALEELDEASAEEVAAMRRELEELAEAMREQAESAEQAAAAEPLFDIDESLAEELRALSEALDAAAEKVGEASESVPSSAVADALEEARGMLGAGAEEFDKEAMEPLEDLEKGYPLIEDAARFAALYVRQRDLARRMESLKGSADLDSPEGKVRMADLADEQEGLREELSRILEDIRAHEMMCPEGEQFAELKQQAREFVEGVEGSGADGEMDEVGISLAEGDGAGAAEHASRAEQILSKFVSKCQAMAGDGQACLCFSPRLASAMSGTIGQLLGMGQMGVGMGMAGLAGMGGMESGGSSGYSMRMATLNNVGLYGAKEMDSAQSGLGRRDTNVLAGGIRIRSEGGRAEGFSTPEDDVSSGAGMLQGVPVQYRRRVREYFRQVAEDTSGRPGSYRARGRQER